MKAGSGCQFGFGALGFKCVAAALGFIVAGAVPVRAQADKAAAEEKVFTLKEVSALERGMNNFVRGQYAQSQDGPAAEVKAYPSFQSQKPVYGSIRFSREASQPESGVLYYFAVDESEGTGKGYDRLYFDVNRDLDLRNDPVVKPQRNPQGLLTYDNIKQQVIFNFLELQLDSSANLPRVQVMPRLTVSVYDKEEYKQMSFVRTRLWEGDIKIGGQEYRAALGNDYLIYGRLDTPGTTLLLSPKAQSRSSWSGWWGGDRLMAAHKIDGKFYTFSASPTGEKLTVRPYLGELGTFEVGPGSRALDKLSVSGSLTASNRAVPVGASVTDGSPEPARSCQLPVGDYLPDYLTIQFGRLRIAVSQNYHSEGKPRDRAGRAPVYGMTVRKDKPCVLDFSNKPEVMFASPAKDQRVKVGETLEVKAILVDPKLDIMIRGLDDTTRKQNKTADGQSLGYEREVSLDPTVIVTRANGEKVAEGVMPFG